VSSPRVRFVSLAVILAASAAPQSACATHSHMTTPSPTATSTGLPSASVPSGPADYTGLLIHACEINVVPDPDHMLVDKDAIHNPDGQPGATTTFATGDNSRTISDTIRIMPDPAVAAQRLDKTKAALHDIVTGPPASADVGTGGTVASGLSRHDPSVAVTMLLFTEGSSFVILNFLSAANDPVPQEFVTFVGQKQDDAIKNGHGQSCTG
jgi:hypothetical protein